MSSASRQILRVGLIGAGWVTYHHLLAWQKLTGAKVVAVCDPNQDNARKRAGAFAIDRIYRDAREMLEREDLDAVDIASPRETHPDMVRLAAGRGLAILCQKPFAPTLNEAEAVTSELPAGLRIMVHENWRYRPYYRQIKTWLAQRAIGTLQQSVMTLFSSGMLPAADGKRPLLERQPFMRTLDRMLVMEVLIHHLDTLRFLLGPLTVMHAQLARATSELTGEDAASITMRTHSNASVVLLGNVAAAGYPPVLIDRLTILGESGSILLEGSSLILVGDQSQTLYYDLPESYQASYDAAIKHFVDCIARDAAFETPPVDNLETLRLVETIYAMHSA